MLAAFHVTQLKEMEKQLPPEVYDSETFKSMQTQIEAFLNTSGTQAAEFSSSLPADLESDQKNAPVTNPLGVEDHVNAAGLTDLTQNGESSVQDSSKLSISITRDAVPQQSTENGSRSAAKYEGEPESTEQFEPGVYVTFIALKNGTKIFKRVRFRYVYRWFFNCACVWKIYAICYIYKLFLIGYLLGKNICLWHDFVVILAIVLYCKDQKTFLK